MKVNKKIIGLILAGGLLIGTGFAVGNSMNKSTESIRQVENIETQKEIEGNSEDQTVSEAVTNEQKEILTSATDDELADATEKFLKESFDESKYDIEVDNNKDSLSVAITIKDSNFRGLSQNDLKSITEESGLGEKMDKLANRIHETWVASGKDKKVILGLFDDTYVIIYTTSSK